MLVSQLAPANGYPHVQNFVVTLLDMQFSDVRAMLQLPLPHIGIMPGCNFAIVSSLCNLISGISTTIYKPPHLLNQVQSQCGSGAAFRGLVSNFYPYTPPGTNSFPQELYQLCRNPLAHSAGLMHAPAPTVTFTRIFDPAHPNTGWSDQELNNLENSNSGFAFPHPGIVVNAQVWTIHCDQFYLDVIAMLRSLNSNIAQMQAAENRFQQGVYNWRI